MAARTHKSASLIGPCTCITFLALGTTPAHAQGFGAIAGTITDASGAVVPGATVTVSETATRLSRSVASDERGHYAVPSLRPAAYALLVELTGFRTFSRPGVVLLADQTVVLDVRLELGAS